MPSYKIFVILLLCLFSSICYSASIKGKIQLSDDWASVLYLSVIPAFHDLNTASYDFLRYKIPIDSNGYFEFSNMELATDDRIYRLHVCKKEDPVSTIIIGGQEENFIHFLMNQNSNITITQRKNTTGIQNCSTEGHLDSRIAAKLFALQKAINTPPELPSEQNRSFVKAQIKEQLLIIADTNSNYVIKLLAMHFINENFAASNNLKLMEKIDQDLAISNYSSPYYKSFSTELSFRQFQQNSESTPLLSALKWILLSLLFSIVVFFLWPKGKPKQSQQKATNSTAQLSKQEKRVYNLVKSGKSNKEISSELHIEVSTVK
ncbi:MAG: LuxR C-terminal-related transcriptional regulator, partial [Saprospiraceae bacterium]